VIQFERRSAELYRGAPPDKNCARPATSLPVAAVTRRARYNQDINGTVGVEARARGPRKLRPDRFHWILQFRDSMILA